MLALYPSNKLEHLSYLLAALLKQQPGPVLQPETILVESPGMQHWLNMELARQQGVAMNLAFPLPVRFMWDIARLILGEDKVPRQSAYRREVLVWRIDHILQHEDFCALPEAQPVCRYWQHLPTAAEQGVQRLQFATALADVFEQYLLYRPQWLFAWEAGELSFADNDDERWQAAIWRALVKDAPLHPARLHQQAVQALHDGQAVALPARVIVFAINTMAPQLVQFFDALALHTDIHVFHLNPSVSYWGESKSDRQRARLLRQQGIEQWRDNEQDNPLLGNLGQQGRDLFNLLTELDTFEVSAFDTEPPAQTDSAIGLLQQIQQDILHGVSPDGDYTYQPGDDSVMVVKAHSALREVQGLHDNLLYLMQQDPELKPSDIVVMCPAIEEYAPLIDAVFHRVGTPAPPQQTPPRIVCSIADRSPLDADPLIAAFISMLSLPDSRFEVTKIMDYLRLDALRNKFGIDPEELHTMQYWLEQAHVHWGVNRAHKKAITQGADDSDMFSWHWGLTRLLVGMAMPDEATVMEELLSVPDVEGQQSVALGKLILLIEQLQHYAAELQQPRTAGQWHTFLTDMRDECFAPQPEHQDSWESIGRATADLAAHCLEAGYASELTLRQVRDVLVRRFSSPDAGNHFLTGQVTFCSMLPMRSIPFKVVCVLGLNDGEFPRQSTPISIDLMAAGSHRQGDRSRRLEDRYLFLEGIISARQHLYLSYQANSAQDNSERQPSLVLSELLRLLHHGYQFDPSFHQTLALHPFSVSRFQSSRPGFEQGWHRLAKAIVAREEAREASIEPLAAPNQPEQLSCDVLARSMAEPIRYFANQQLGLYLDTAAPALKDAEPFDSDPLTRYQVLAQLTESQLEQQDPAPLIAASKLSGQLPATPLTDEALTRWQTISAELAAVLPAAAAQTEQWHSGQVCIRAQASIGPKALAVWHTGGQSDKRKLQQYLTLLVFNALGHALPLEAFFITWTKGQPALRKAMLPAVSAEQADARLQQCLAVFRQLNAQPLPCFVSAIVSLLKKVGENDLADWLDGTEAQSEWQKLWEGSPAAPGLGQDSYARWFYPHGLSLEAVPVATLADVYQPLVSDYKEKKV